MGLDGALNLTTRVCVARVVDRLNRRDPKMVRAARFAPRNRRIVCRRTWTYEDGTPAAFMVPRILSTLRCSRRVAFVPTCDGSTEIEGRPGRSSMVRGWGRGRWNGSPTRPPRRAPGGGAVMRTKDANQHHGASGQEPRDDGSMPASEGHAWEGIGHRQKGSPNRRAIRA
jgi:hypothetical protein